MKVELKGMRHAVLRAYAALQESWDKKGGGHAIWFPSYRARVRLFDLLHGLMLKHITGQVSVTILIGRHFANSSPT